MSSSYSSISSSYDGDSSELEFSVEKFMIENSSESQYSDSSEFTEIISYSSSSSYDYSSSSDEMVVVNPSHVLMI
jgi:hypothetical protein